MKNRIEMVLSLLFFLLLLATFVNAQNLTAEFKIKENTVNVTYSFVDNPSTFVLIPLDAKNILFNNIEYSNYSSVENFIKIIVPASGQSMLTYTSPSYLEQAEDKLFITEVISSFNGSMTLTVTLPEGAVLSKKIESDLSTPSILPKPSAVGTDGKAISIVWTKNNASRGESLPVVVSYKMPRNQSWTIIIAVVVIAAIAGLAFALYMPKTRIVHVIKKVDEVEKHLKEEEKQVIEVLKLKEGRTSQSTIQIATGISKATLSRILSELEQRKVIIKEKKGKKNLIILIKEF